MLVENKFLYLSLPRCASTSFNYSCILNNINVQTYNGEWEIANNDIDFTLVDKSKIMNFIYHGHESIGELRGKFGYNYPVISVKRQRHERFFSLYKHVLFDLKRTGHNDIHDAFSNLDLDGLFFFTKDDLITKRSRWEVISDYLIDLKLLDKKIDISVTSKFKKSEEEYFKKNTKAYVINMIDILLTPISFWTNNDKDIIWFDFSEMDKLEDWVSEKLNKPFKLQSVNSSKHIDCKIIFNDEFIKKYDAIYDYYDLPKTDKSII